MVDGVMLLMKRTFEKPSTCDENNFLKKGIAQ